ncbi:unnamed protein product, partial [Linum tenue]
MCTIYRWNWKEWVAVGSWWLREIFGEKQLQLLKVHCPRHLDRYFATILSVEIFPTYSLFHLHIMFGFCNNTLELS